MLEAVKWTNWTLKNDSGTFGLSNPSGFHLQRTPLRSSYLMRRRVVFASSTSRLSICYHNLTHRHHSHFLQSVDQIIGLSPILATEIVHWIFYHFLFLALAPSKNQIHLIHPSLRVVFSIFYRKFFIVYRHLAHQPQPSIPYTQRYFCGLVLRLLRFPSWLDAP